MTVQCIEVPSIDILMRFKVIQISCKHFGEKDACKTGGSNRKDAVVC